MARLKRQRKKTTPFAKTFAQRLIETRNYNDLDISRLINNVIINEDKLHIPTTRVQKIRTEMGLPSVKKVRRARVEHKAGKVKKVDKYTLPRDLRLAITKKQASQLKALPEDKKFEALENLVQARSQLAESFNKLRSERARNRVGLELEEIEFLIKELCSTLPKSVLKQMEIRF